MSEAAVTRLVEVPSAASVASVIVTFHPDQRFQERMAALGPLVGAIIVVDNGSRPSELPLDHLLPFHRRAEVIANGENRGVAVAFNQGFARAQALGFRWVLTLDQDSEPQAGLLQAAARVFASHPEPGNLAAIGAGIVGETPSIRKGQSAYQWRPVVITSGTVYPISVWESIGGFREDYFVDYVDIEYCLRARACGFGIVQSTEPCLVHKIGHPVPRRVLGRWMAPTNHDARRRYYITRNRILVWRRYFGSDRRYIVHDMRHFARETMMVLLAETDRMPKVRAILAGIRDSVLGRLGPTRPARSSVERGARPRC